MTETDPLIGASDEVDPDADADDFTDSLTDPVIGAALGEESYLDDDATGLWDGDRGSLDTRQRDTLVMLLKKAFISSDDKAEWRVLTRDPGPIETNLNNLYFNLVIDQRSEVAYATPARTTDNLFKTLVKDTANNREETLLLLFLREKFRASSAAGEAHVVTDATAMYAYVQRFRPDSATDHSGDERKVTNAISALLTAGLLVKTKDDGRFRVHRAIEALLPLNKLNQLLEAFRELNTAPIDDDSTLEPGGTTSPGRHAAPDTSRAELDRAAALADMAAAERIDAQHDTQAHHEDGTPAEQEYA